MIEESSIEIDAPPSTVWAVFTDVERWSDWTESIDRIAALDGAAISVGHRFEIKQPRLPKVVWTVTEVESGTSWTWRTHSPGATTLASHELVETQSGGTFVHQRIEHRGALGVLFGTLMRRTTKRYLELEAQGLKGRSEQQLPDAASR
jgi:uncharacterized protein YndB with AHSA1/START domain